MAVKKQQEDVSWSEWPEELKNRDPETLEAKRAELKTEIDFYRFQQYLFSVQWKKLKAYANEQGIGDHRRHSDLCGLRTAPIPGRIRSCFSLMRRISRLR